MTPTDRPFYPPDREQNERKWKEIIVNVIDFRRLLQEDHRRVGSYKKIERITGVPATTVQHWERELKIAPDIANLLKYVRGIDCATDRKQRYFLACGYPVPEEFAVPSGREITYAGPVGELIMVPLLGSVHAGSLAGGEDCTEDHVPTSPIPGVRKEDLVWLRVKGDCMDKAGLPEGSLALVEKGNLPRSGGIGVLFSDDEYIIRRYVDNGKSRLLVAVSNNPDYNPIVLDSDGWRCYGVVKKAEVSFD